MNIEELKIKFEENKNEEQAIKMEKYLKNQFSFLGISKPARSILEKDFIKEQAKKDKSEVMDMICKLHKMEYREYMYCAQNLALKIYKTLTIEDIHVLCDLTLINSWWENTDGYVGIIRRWFYINPQEVNGFVNKYYDNEDFWLRRISIICQLSIKENMDFESLKKTILHNIDYNEFFVQKAIGWALRDYSKYNANVVRDFINKYDEQLSNLAKREGSKYI